MPFEKLLLKSGIDVNQTPTLNSGGWSGANLVRFRLGLPEVIGGWQTFLTGVVQGICRGLHAWTTLALVNTLGIGTTQRLYVSQGSALFDVTPAVRTSTLTNPFATTAGSAVITVTDAGFGQAVGQYVEITSATPVGGLTLAGEYVIASIVSVNSYTITAAGNATSTATGGGATTILYLLAAGAVDQSSGSGYGIGGYGLGTYGTARTVSTVQVTPRIWTIDNWGEIMVACPRDGGIYAWLPATGTGVRAAAITGAPMYSKGILVAMPQRQLIAYGSTSYGGTTQDPMLMCWSDVNDYTDWNPLVTNSAGSQRLSDGSEIKQVLRAPQQMLIWTDNSLTSMQFLGGQLVYGFTQLGTHCGSIAPQAAVVVNNNAYWMSNLNFFVYNGSVAPLDCPVRDLVYRGMNQLQVDKIYAVTNTGFDEIWWFYCSSASTEIDSYVIFNYQDNDWSVGKLVRTAWIDTNVFGNPIAIDTAGQLWTQEFGYSANGSAMPFYLQSGYADISKGEQFMFIDQMIADNNMTGGPVAITVAAQKWPNDVVTIAGPYTMSTTTDAIPLRLRGRQLSFRIDNTFAAPNTFWRLGAVRVRVAPDGRQ